jgi:hypothetical protein
LSPTLLQFYEPKIMVSHRVLRIYRGRFRQQFACFIVICPAIVKNSQRNIDLRQLRVKFERPFVIDRSSVLVALFREDLCQTVICRCVSNVYGNCLFKELSRCRKRIVRKQGIAL